VTTFPTKMAKVVGVSVGGDGLGGLFALEDLGVAG